MSFRFGYNFSFFLNNILWYFLSIFIFSRLFYIVADWNNMKFIKNPFEFFIMSDYNFSLFWAVFWFFLVFFIMLKIDKRTVVKYIDGVVLSFLFILILWYIGAFFGGQVYGLETHFWIEVSYNHPFSTIPYEVPIFPLAIVYAVLFFIVFSVLYTVSILVNIRGLIWYVWLILTWLILFIFEFFDWQNDIFKLNLNLNLTQICSIVLIAFASYGLYKVSTNKSINKEVNI